MRISVHLYFFLHIKVILINHGHRKRVYRLRYYPLEWDYKPYLFIFSYSVVRLTPSLFAVSDLLPEVISKHETIAARSVSSITSAKVRIED